MKYCFIVLQMYYYLGDFSKSCMEGSWEPLRINKNVELLATYIVGKETLVVVMSSSVEHLANIYEQYMSVYLCIQVCLNRCTFCKATFT